jgi:predicted amidohydrolase
MEKRPYLAAAVQMEVEYEPYPADGTIRWILDAADEAAAKGAKLIVFPETANAEWFFDNPEAAAKVAATKDGWFVRDLGAKAAQHGVFIAAGLTELDAGTGQLYNSTVIIGPAGKVASLYRKHFLIGYDKRWATPGDNGFPVIETPLGTLAAFICADARIPEVTRCPALEGAQVMVNTSNWGGTDQYTAHVPARAAENRVWVVAANKSGRDQPGKANVGHSIIVAPTGSIVAEGGNRGPEIIYGEIDPAAALDKTWAGLDLFEARRPRHYAILETPMAQTPLAEVLRERVRPDDITASASAVQVSFTESHAKTLELALEYADYARHRNYTDIVVLPEQFLFKPASIAKDPAGCADLSDRALKQFSAWSARGGVHAVLNMVERDADRRFYSTAYLVHPDGALDRYRKTHLTHEESRWATPGGGLPVFTTRFGKVGIMLGHEGLLPEVARCLTLGGADLICWPCTWTSELDYGLIATERVLENRISLVASNRLDSPVAGPSVILQGLLSRSLSSAASWSTEPGRPDMVTALLNLAMSRSKRIYSNTDVLFHRQPQYYGRLTRDSNAASAAMAV